MYFSDPLGDCGSPRQIRSRRPCPRHHVRGLHRPDRCRQAAARQLHSGQCPQGPKYRCGRKSRHPEIVKLGLHATPPSATDKVIIANDITSKIGKKSSAADMEKLVAGKAIAVRIEKDSIYDLLLPITDAHGGDLNDGFVVMEVPLHESRQRAGSAQDRRRRPRRTPGSIENKAALYQR